MTTTYRFLITDDHAVVRRGLHDILADAFPGAEFGEATNASEALELIFAEDWSLIVLDITMPGRSGLELLADIRHARPSVPVLVLSVHAEEQYAVRVLRSGASGYVTKDQAPDELEQAVRRVLSGGRYISSSVAEMLADDLVKQGREPHELLSDREFEVFVRIARGEGVSMIAGSLSLSVKTISTYRARVLEKTGLTGNADITRYALARRLIE